MANLAVDYDVVAAVVDLIQNAMPYPAIKVLYTHI